MSSIRQKIASLKLPLHVLTYCFTFMCCGLVMTAFGPYIPYLAHQTGHLQTDYTFLLFCRSIGYFLGATLLKFLQKKFTFHRIIMCSSILLLIFMTLFNFVFDFLIQGILALLISTNVFMINILINVCVSQTQKYGDVAFWMQILHVMYGIGGLLSPFLIYIFHFYSYLVLGIMMIAVAPLFKILPSPEIKLNYCLQVYAGIQYIQNQNQKQSQNLKQSVKLSKRKFVNKDSEYILCFLFWTYIGLQLGFGNWISSYAVLQKVATKQSALKYNSIFWSAMAICRLLATFLPYKSMKKILILEYVLTLFAILSVVLVFKDNSSLACIQSSLTYGICFSSMYPLLLSIPIQYNFHISANQMANIALWSAIGQATLASSFGLFMEWISNNMLFYIILIMMVIFIFATHYLQQLFQKQQKKVKNIELEQVLNIVEGQKNLAIIVKKQKVVVKKQKILIKHLLISEKQIF